MSKIKELKNMTAKGKKAIKVTVDVLLTLFLVFAVLITIYATLSINSKDGASIGNYKIVTIQSNSMKSKNGFTKGSVIIVKKLTLKEAENLKVGQVITFKADLNKDGVYEELNTHRIVEPDEGETLEKGEYRTKGDNNDIRDGETVSTHRYGSAGNQIVGVWTGFKLGGVGYFIDFMRAIILSGWGFFVVIVLPLGVFFVFEIINVVKLVGQVKGKKTITASDEEEIKRKAVEEYLKSLQENNDTSKE